MSVEGLNTVYSLAVGLKDGRLEHTSHIFSDLETAIAFAEKDMEEVDYIESMYLLKLEEAFSDMSFIHVGTWTLDQGYGWQYETVKVKGLDFEAPSES